MPIENGSTLYCAQRIVLDPEHAVENGALFVHKGRIEAVGPRAEFSAVAEPGVRIVDFGPVALLPGLVNAHAHLEYSCCRGLFSPVPFTQWLRRMVRVKPTLTSDQILNWALDGAVELARTGTTTVGDISTYDTAVFALVETGLRHVTYCEVISMAQPPYDAILEHLDRRLENLAIGPRGQVGISPHAPYTVALPLVRRLREYYSGPRSLPFASHVAESSAELYCLRWQAGPLAWGLRRAGFYPKRRQDTPLAKSPMHFVQAALEEGASPFALVHGNRFSTANMRKLARDSKVTLTVCPGTRQFHNQRSPVLRRAMKAGMTVALGTDSLASNTQLDMWAEMRLALAQCPQWSAADAFEAATIGGARALGMEGEIGVLKPGYNADFVVAPLDQQTSSLTDLSEYLSTILTRANSPKITHSIIGGEDIFIRPAFATSREWGRPAPN